MRTLLLTILISSLAAIAPPATQPAPTADYDQSEIEGWPIYLSKEVKTHAKLSGDVLALLRVRLFEVKQALPAAATEKLQHVPIWIELHDRQFTGMCYHPSAEWLRENGFNPEKAGAVEIGDAQHFIAWSHEQPAMVLHELAHAYHHQVLGFDYAPIKQAYKNALDKKLFDNVLRINGHRERAYAMNNDQEYFAESSEAYFATNDFFPFVRAELTEHDPEMSRVLKEAWGEK